MVKLLGQVPDVGVSTEETVTGPQSAVIVPPWAIKPAESVAASGTAEAHCTVAGPGQVIDGGGTKRRFRSLLLLASSSLKWPPPSGLLKLAVLRLKAAGSKLVTPVVVLRIRQ